MSFYSKLERFCFYSTYPINGWKRKNWRPKTMCGLAWYFILALVAVGNYAMVLYVLPEFVYEFYSHLFFDGDELGYVDLSSLPLVLQIMVFPSIITAMMISVASIVIPFVLFAVGVFFAIKFVATSGFGSDVKPFEPVANLVRGTGCGLKSMFSKVKCKWYVNYED